MALPSAGLGSLPSLNVPSFIPVHETRDEPELWKRALLGILANAGSALVTQGIQNLGTNDRAAEFGEAPRTGFSKIFKGPQVSEDEAVKRRGLKLEKDKLSAAERQNRMGNMLERTRMNQEATRNTMSSTNDLSRIAAGAQTADLDREVDVEKLRNEAAARKLAGLIDEMNALRQGRVAEAQISNLDAETSLRRTEADRQQMITDIMSGKRRGGEQPAQNIIDPAVQQFVSQGMGQQVQATPESVDPISSLVQSGVPVEEIVRRLDPNALTPRQQQVQNIAASRATQEETAAAELERKVNEVRMRLMGNVPGVIPGTLPGEYGGL